MTPPARPDSRMPVAPWRTCASYLGVGALAYLANAAILLACVEVLGLGYLAGMCVSMIGVTIGAHFLNRRLTFGSGGHYIGELLRYSFVVVLQSAAGLGLMAIFVEVLGMHYLVANFIAAAALAVASFLLHDAFSFRVGERK